MSFGKTDGENPIFLQRLAALAKDKGQNIEITSGFRSIEEQQKLYDAAKEAQDAIKEVIEAQDKAIADAKKKRNKLITEADDALANGTITQKEHDNIVKKVQSQYDTET